MQASIWIIGARFAEYLATGLLFGTPLFLIYAKVAARPVTGARGWSWRTGLAGGGALVVASTLLWVALQTATMSGDLRAATDPAALWSMLADTPFGHAALLRLIAGGVAILVVLVRPVSIRAERAAVAALGAVMVASLAWSGHGAADEGGVGLAHLAADALHLLAAGIWTGALSALCVLVGQSRRSGQESDARAAHRALSAFSGLGTTVVLVLLLSGIVNGWLLIGPAHLTALITTLYGLLLSAKLLVFGLMLGLAATNRYLLTPRLARDLNGAAPTAASVQALQASILFESALLIAVLLIVSWLGTLAPPMAS